MRRPLLYLAAALRPVRDGYRFSKELMWLMYGLFIITVPATILIGPSINVGGPLAWLSWLAVPVWILGLPVLYVMVTFASIGWHAGGAGRPVLVVKSGEVRGRIRGLWAGQEGSPDDGDWWDIRIPVSDLIGVRVDDKVGRSPTIVLDLPQPLTDRLLSQEGTREIAGRWFRDTGSPVGWQIGMFESRLTRGRRLRAVLAALNP